MKRPIEFTIAIGDFPSALLPAGSRQPGSAALTAAIARIYEAEFAHAGGTVAVQVTVTGINVKWLTY